MQLALARCPECCVLPCRAGADGCLLPGDAQAAAGQFAPGRAVLLAGPGLGAGAGAVLQALLGGSSAWKACVLDADALNALGRRRGPARALPENTVLTPHPGEMARLTGLTVAQVAGRPAGRRRAVRRPAPLRAGAEGQRHRDRRTGRQAFAQRHRQPGSGAGRQRGYPGRHDRRAAGPGACPRRRRPPAASGCTGPPPTAARPAKASLPCCPHDIFDDLGALLAGMGR